MITTSHPIRVLVVDDTVVYRKIVTDVLAALPGVTVVGSAHNGTAAIQKIGLLKPDLVTLDIEMPEKNGLEVLEYIRENAPGTGAIMLSTLTREGGAMTMKALELGAFDFIPKPQSGTVAENRGKIADAIRPMLMAFRRGNQISRLTRHAPHPEKSAVPPLPASLAKSRSEIVAIGISTGGPNALARMLPMLPKEMGVPIVIVQHMPPMFTQSLANSLDAKCNITVREAKQGEPLVSNTAFIAPGGKQMKIVAGADGKSRILKITDDPPENSCKPSADYLFRSVAHHYVGRATGVIMTGMGSDGTKGLQLMKQNGATIIAQNEATCVVFGMPKEPIETGLADVVLPLDQIAAMIVKTVRAG
ncbi:chemotaxis response regulator protein-glutamate methylesterase [Desulfosarcina sp. OttesenSCG-928-B08]|nr:chemotaxis response regulator protein-glutamate methylesterase [Desulfosarcina sp. OttesenSCG-928-B08]